MSATTELKGKSKITDLTVDDLKDLIREVIEEIIEDRSKEPNETTKKTLEKTDRGEDIVIYENIDDLFNRLGI